MQNQVNESRAVNNAGVPLLKCILDFPKLQVDSSPKIPPSDPAWNSLWDCKVFNPYFILVYQPTLHLISKKEVNMEHFWTFLPLESPLLPHPSPFTAQWRTGARSCFASPRWLHHPGSSPWSSSLRGPRGVASPRSWGSSHLSKCEEEREQNRKTPPGAKTCHIPPQRSFFLYI